ncbi:molybdate ABC transporter, inner membrane subunit [Rippkaea orientalis PCC 8801]|uniref:Molybdate ABC transporter, inner membrane subunit n=1 Tax=Rippkaea orientalis (strain PCC 8801 / RF-1) TaxID=41431 RepID=B7K049_RIPO1|nr:molybdate ABC transporter permease subunit [Rippkaea orientalis]ACK66196.1 molybdate ABC transporter, inner membrane subunit [Rippkaea orientalis PCC 8801]
MDLDISPLFISLRASIIATIIVFFIGMAAARWMLDYKGKGKGIIDSIFIAPLVLPPTVVGFLLLLLLGNNSPIGQLLYQFEYTIIFTWEATVITATVVAFPLMYRTTLGAFEQIDPNIILAARTLGASEWRIFWTVMIPLSYRGLVAATILSFARALGEFGATLMLAGNIPSQTQTMPVAIFFAAESGDMRTALIWVLILLFISMSVIIIVNFWAETTKLKRQGKKIKKHKLFKPENLSDKSSYLIDTSGLILNIEKQLHGFSLETNFQANQETLGLLGASGSGKSMTLRCIAGLETPDRGFISLNGQILFDSAKKINLPSSQRNVGFVFQNYALFSHLNVSQNIAFGIQHLSKTEQEQSIKKYIKLMELQGLEKRYPHQLSGGQQQRVALARALATEPQALLLDEPFSALDTYLRYQLQEQLINTLSTYKGVTLFVTHNLEEVYQVCPNLLIIDQGKTIAYGDKYEIFEYPTTYAVAQLTGCKNFSRAKAISPTSVEALDWGCSLTVIEPIPESLAYIGIRAHHLTFVETPDTENTFPCSLVKTRETPHRMTLYLQVHSMKSTQENFYLLQAELFKEKWDTLKDRPQPWYVRLNPVKLFLMQP